MVNFYSMFYDFSFIIDYYKYLHQHIKYTYF